MAHEVTNWLYPINPTSGYHLEATDTGVTTTVSPENLRQSIEDDPDQIDQWLLSTGFRLMRPGDAVWIYAAGIGGQRICALARAMDLYQNEQRGTWHVDLLWDLEATRLLMDHHPIPRAEFDQIPQQAAVRADDHTNAVLSRWLENQDFRLTHPDDDDPPGSPGDARLRVLAEIVRRQGQQAFRKRLLDAYEARCAVTGPNPTEVLEAAHITPYQGLHSNDVRNGLLLRADLHTLFDLHLVGVDPQSRLVVSRGLADTNYAKLDGTPLHLPRSTRLAPSKKRLAEHLSRLR